ncbi:maleylpyruvate isomerase family mycothiol-dependent enzyme [Herbiconiux daphne]|uniref:Maleylpyruvate isomerase family mycothiol-dependent enzyme n=1 Tax=Herbiconiux daphne TaxID=2970914 RepID=A0ABT2H4A5_9MICO|nr:maleylpyruvate isomerase family mycothiol-dependent enzyme [Herbiconiux daphne]MCS5734767.1 maleylpyruvate isomerase family mycothiol-dependent enzyme [Herbiconiux daphne]
MTVLTDRATDAAVLDDLRQVRLGQANFSRKLNELQNVDLYEISRLPGWTRAHVVAHVGYNARAIARLVEWAETGVENPMYESSAHRDAEIDLGATLSPRALRHLSDHAAVALDVAWRDLPPERWSFPVVTARGREVPVAETVWMRTRELWLHALDLGNGGRFSDVPAPVARRLLGDVLGTWAARDKAGAGPRHVLEATDTGEVFRADGGPDAPDTLVRGTRSDLLAWATGRSVLGVTLANGDAPDVAPRWL